MFKSNGKVYENIDFDPYLGCYSDEVQPSRSLY